MGCGGKERSIKSRPATGHAFGRRILLIVFASLLFFTVLVNALVIRVLQQGWEATLLQQQQEMSEMVTRRLDNALDSRRQTLERLTVQLHDGEALLPLPQIQAGLDSRIQLHHFFSGGMVVLDHSGRSIVDSPLVPGRVGIDFSDREHVREVGRTRSSVITHPLIGRGLQAPVFVINAPILSDDGSLLGYLFGVTRLADDTFFQQIGSETFGHQADLLVYDPALQLVVTASDPALAMTQLPEGRLAVVDAVLAGKTIGFLNGEDGERLLFASARLESMGWLVIHSLSRSLTTGMERQVVVTSLLLISLFMLLVMLAVWLLLRTQLATLSETAATIEGMVNGRQPLQPLPVHRDDEVGALITAFNRLQTQLAQHITELRQSNRDLHRLSEITAHHLMEPSRRLLSFSRQLRSRLGDREDPDLLQILDFIDQGASRLRNLVRDMQRYLDADTPGGAVELQPVQPIVESVIARLARRHPEAYARATIRVGALPSAAIDRKRCAELFDVLLENALVHAAGQSPLMIEVEGQVRDGVVRYTISDNGPGIPAAYQERLFEIFERLESDDRGTGVGLAIARHIVERLGGSIELEAVPEGGTRIAFELGRHIE